MYALPILRFTLFILITTLGSQALADKLILASTTSLDNSGLYDYLLPHFRAQSGIDIAVIAVGTGRAMSIGRRGDADLLIVHDRKSELEFVAQGYGVDCTNIMYNHYLIVGPRDNPAGINSGMDIASALRSIAKSESVFISRGDDSGTHKKEISLWKQAGMTPSAQSDWYLEVGRGMSVVLNIANEKLAYTLTDYATWLSFKARDNLKVVYRNQEYMYNPYSIILVNPERNPDVNYTEAKVFAQWIKSSAALKLIAQFKVNNKQLFFPLFGPQQKQC